MVCQPCAPMDAEAGEDDENDEDDQEDDPILSLPPVLVATSLLVLAEAADFVLSTRADRRGLRLAQKQALLEESGKRRVPGAAGENSSNGSKGKSRRRHHPRGP